MFKINLKNKNILITGINGFVGRHLQQKLISLGANVFGVSTKVASKNILKINVLDYQSIDNFVKEKKIQICYHLAGESLVESGQYNPLNTFKVNIDGALNILEISRKNNLERIIIASTSHVYGKNDVPYLEIYTPKPSRPYETSKACTDLIAQSYADTYNLPILIPRFVNIYGPGDLNFTRLIPSILKEIVSNNQIHMWGGNAVRDFIYIDDAVDAYIKMATMNLEELKENRILNFGGGNIITIKDLVEKIVKISQRKVKIIKTREIRESEIKSQYVSFDKAKKILKWSPQISLDEGLRRTFNWYSRYFTKTSS